MDHFSALRILALSDVAEARRDGGTPSPAYMLRRIARWYSTEFSTPLHQVDELPLDDLMQAWYESQYEELSDEKLNHELATTTETPAEKLARETKVHQDKLDTWRLEHEDDEDDDLDTAFRKATGDKPVGPAAGTMAHQPKRPQLPLQKPERSRPGEEVSLPTATRSVTEGIQKTFIDLAEMERLVEMDGLGQIEPLVLDDP